MGTQRAEPGHPAGRPRRRQSSEFTARVALEALKGQKTLNEMASEFGVHAVQIAQWKRQLLDASAGVFENGASGRRERDQVELVEHLYQEIGPLKVEVDWLRKQGISRLSNSGRSLSRRIRSAASHGSATCWGWRGRAGTMRLKGRQRRTAR